MTVVIIMNLLFNKCIFKFLMPVLKLHLRHPRKKERKRPDILLAILFKTFNKSLTLCSFQHNNLDYQNRDSIYLLNIDPLDDPPPHMATLPYKAVNRPPLS